MTVTMSAACAVRTAGQCNTAGNVNVGERAYNVGGLCGGGGYRDGTISDSSSSCSVIGGDDCSGLGGLCGSSYFSWMKWTTMKEYTSITISDSFATGDVTGGDRSFELGGLCGINYRKFTGDGEVLISNSYAIGDVTGGSGSEDLGGLWRGSWKTVI